MTHPTSIEDTVHIEGAYEESYSAEDGWSGNVLADETSRYSVKQGTIMIGRPQKHWITT